MIFGGRATFYIALLCVFCTSFFNAFSATRSGRALKNISLYTPILQNTLTVTNTDQVKDTTYYKKVLDTASNNRIRLIALDSLIRKNDRINNGAFVSYSEKYVRLALALKEYDSAVDKLKYYVFELNASMNDPDRADQFLQSITLPLEKVNDRSLVSNFLYYKGSMYSKSGKLQEAIDTYTKVYTSSSPKDSVIIMEALHERGFVHEMKGNYSQAMADFMEAQQYFKRIEDYENMFFIQESLNVLYGRFGLEEKSIEEMKKLVTEKIKRKYTQYICYDYYNISVSYTDLKDPLNAKKYAELALETALEEAKTTDHIALHEFYLNVANVYMEQDIVKGAKPYLDLAKDYLLKQKAILTNNYFYQITSSTYFLKTGRLSDAENTALSLLKKIDRGTQSQERKTVVYELLYAIYDAKRDYKKSLVYYKAYTQLKDSVFSAQKAHSLSYHQTLYETEKKEKEIASQELNLQSQERIITTQNRQQSYFVIGLSVLALVLIGSFFFIKKIRIERKKVADSLLEKELLLKEIHHRVKNNLQIVYGLMYKQARISKDHAFKALMEDAQSRIKSMAMIHQKLYQNNNFSEVDMKGYISELVKDIDHSFNASNVDVDVSLQMAVTKFHMDIAIPLGLILNELITNIYKHAFSNGEGKVLVSIEKVADQHQIMVKDNGVGLPKDLNLKGSTSLGMNLIAGLCDQIRATFNYKNNNGSEFTILLNANG